MGGKVDMSDGRGNKRRTMARILALVIAGIMVFSVAIAIILK